MVKRRDTVAPARESARSGGGGPVGYADGEGGAAPLGDQ